MVSGGCVLTVANNGIKYQSSGKGRTMIAGRLVEGVEQRPVVSMRHVMGWCLIFSVVSAVLCIQLTGKNANKRLLPDMKTCKRLWLFD